MVRDWIGWRWSQSPSFASMRHRRSIRLGWYDYRWSGWYFITAVTHERQPVFAERQGTDLTLTNLGRLVDHVWAEIPRHFRHVSIDAFVIMPDHIHGIVVLHGVPRSPAAAGLRVSSGSLAAVVRSFKAAVSRRAGDHELHTGLLWQRNYFERIIRDERSLIRVRQYIADNPAEWLRRNR